MNVLRCKLVHISVSLDSVQIVQNEAAHFTIFIVMLRILWLPCRSKYFKRCRSIGKCKLAFESGHGVIFAPKKII